MKSLEELEKKLKIHFKNQALLQMVFTHRSYLNEHKGEKLFSNERLEFLGDAILSFWVSSHLYGKYPDLPEGILTNMRTLLVRTESLAEKAKDLELGEYLFLSKGEEKGGGRMNRALLANTFESLTGAIFLEKGLIEVSKFLEKNFSQKIAELGSSQLKDYKSILQEKIQTTVKFSPEYKVLRQEGPDHDKTFQVGVFSQGILLGTGEGKSKQEAEELAAKNALENNANLR
ncbi:MAG: Ribonuclease 3 [Microgenomates group bacterium ADurb.Bin219]|nr:MAG: Ribonuclease 3 [Microgenomates group bacterium ADurb.Bin219]HNP89446.1 ribonuclease III [Candidatus Woesebacteria bacterium]